MKPVRVEPAASLATMARPSARNDTRTEIGATHLPRSDDRPGAVDARSLQRRLTTDPPRGAFVPHPWRPARRLYGAPDGRHRGVPGQSRAAVRAVSPVGVHSAQGAAAPAGARSCVGHLGRQPRGARDRAWQRRVARKRGGAITFVQRFGGLVNLNVHFHLLVPDGEIPEIPAEVSLSLGFAALPDREQPIASGRITPTPPVAVVGDLANLTRPTRSRAGATSVRPARRQMIAQRVR